MCRLAAMSPFSIRFASSISWSAVSSSTRPIERRYRRSESRLGSTVRSSSGFFACARLARLLGLLVGGQAVLGDHVDAVLDQVARAGRCTCSLVTSTSSSVAGDLLEGQVAALAALGDQRAKLVGVLKPGIAVRARRRLLASSPLPGGRLAPLSRVSRTSPFLATPRPVLSSRSGSGRREV